MASLNLGPVQDMIERDLLDDLVRIYPPSAGHTLNGTLNTETMRREPPPAPEPLYDGRASIVDVKSAGLDGPAIPDMVLPDEGTTRYRVLLPLAGTGDIVKGCVVEVYGSRLPDGPRDPAIIGRRIVLGKRAPVSTYAVVRVIGGDDEEARP